MTMRSYPLAIAMMIAVAACRPAVSDYTQSEAPNRLTVDSAASHIELHFAARSDHLIAGDAARLRQLVATGAIQSSDRVTVSAAGPPALAERRTEAVTAALLPYGIVATAAPLGEIAPDRAIVEIGRYLVTLPPCPNWSKPPANEFANTLGSNFGCSTVSNLGQAVASPADLLSGQPLEPADGRPAAAAVGRYLAEKVVLPQASTIGPVTAPTTAAPGTGGAGATPTTGGGS
jgi:pilus assembly protein CpaD